MRYIFLFLISFVVIGYGKKQPASDKLRFHEGERIVLLGNTFADRMRYYGHFETLLQRSLPEAQLSVRNMGWSADEVNLDRKSTRLNSSHVKISYAVFCLK